MHDTIFWDEDVKKHWCRVIDFLEIMGRSWTVLNPEKFQFCAQEVEFAGFLISNSRVSPLPKFLDAIKLFLTQRNITDIHSWFGLVNQVSGYGQLRRFMLPFRLFLSPKVRFNGPKPSTKRSRVANKR